MSSENKIDDGGQVFPIRNDVGWSDCGMTLRDYFAARAMASWISTGSAMRSLTNPKVVKPTDAGWLEVVAGAAYKMADAMLAASRVPSPAPEERT